MSKERGQHADEHRCVYELSHYAVRMYHNKQLIQAFRGLNQGHWEFLLMDFHSDRFLGLSNKPSLVCHIPVPLFNWKRSTNRHVDASTHPQQQKKLRPLNGSSRALCLETSASFNQSAKHNVSIQFLQEPSDLVAVRGQNITLQCFAKSTTGNINISWLYEGMPVPQEDPRWMVNGADLLVLQTTGDAKIASRSNTGDYSCLAANEDGAIVSRTAKVKVATLDKEADVLAGNTTIYKTQPLLLQCIIHSTPSAEIQWEFNQLPLPKDIRYVPLPNGALLIRDTKFSDSGKYRCIARNSVLNEAKTSKYLDVTIANTPTETVAPSIHLVNSSIEQTVLVGGTVEFVCIASGWPTPAIKWQNNKNFTIGVSSVLTVRNAQPADAGNLTCTVSNEGGTLIQSYHLNVFQEPCFNSTPVSKTSPLVQTVRIDCQAKGIPEPKVLWLKNGRPLTQEIRIKRPLTGLVFSHTISTDSALYQCVAVNEVGRVWTAAQLVINNSQSPSPPQNIQCRPYDDDKICLTWNKPENVSVKAYSVYSSYLSQGVEEPGPEYLIQDTFKLAHGLKHSTNYTFYVRLYSNHASDHSEKVTCQTGFKGSRNLDIEMSSITAVKLSWDKLSSDFLCNGTTDSYVVQWFRDGDPTHLSTGLTLETDFIVSGLVSTFLTNLSTDDTYFVMVRAANDVGIGQPCPPIIVRTFHMSKNPNGMLNGSDVAGKQRLGIILGILMAALCILCCVSFILLRRRCLKRRANTRARLAMSSNYHPVVAHYRSQLGTVQVRMDEPCSIAHHEVEQLVAEEPYPHIPPATPEQLDTKGARDLPNGCVNGIGKQSHVNGKVLNGDVHITENPQYYAFECNGNLAKNKSEPLLRHYEEDPNSNVNPSKFYDFYKFFDSAKRCKQSPDKNGHLPSKSNGSSAENSLNSTQLSFLDGSMASNRRLSPVLEPNG
ncbi:hypothetical protein HUJ04_006139 [Dendroctonus ponderosae]|nr:hypothetical protein HUJ04_006139 [Dendroctonus ponderosae]